jgi:tRNA A-37 threonylcarbamoyl transferase component Bud32
MAATAAAVMQFKRVQLAPTQTQLTNGFNQGAQQQLAPPTPANLARPRRAEPPAAQDDPLPGGDLCFNLQPQAASPRVEPPAQQSRVPPRAPPTVVGGVHLGLGRRCKSRGAALSAEQQQQAPTNRITEAKSRQSAAPIAANQTAPTNQRPCSRPATLATVAEKSSSSSSASRQTQAPPQAATTAAAATATAATPTQTVASNLQRGANDLRHWKSSTSSLNCVQIASTRGRRRPVLAAAKSLLQLDTTAASGAGLAPSRPQTALAYHRRAGSLAVISGPALESAAATVDASSAARLLRSYHHLNRHQIRRARREAPPSAANNISAAVATKRAQSRVLQAASKRPLTSVSRRPSAAPASTSVARRAALLAPKRALSCNQLAQKLEQTPKVARTAAGSAVTNSRLRQGALYARRQCQLAASPTLRPGGVESAANLVGQRAARSSALSAAHLLRCDGRGRQHEASSSRQRRLTPLVQVHLREANKTAPEQAAKAAPASTATATTITSKANATTKNTNTTAGKSSAADCKPRDPAHRPTIGRRRWSSLESSNNEDSSPSCSSSTLSTSSSCSLRVDYLAAGATGDGAELADYGGRQAAAQICGRHHHHQNGWRGRRSSSPSPLRTIAFDDDDEQRRRHQPSPPPLRPEHEQRQAHEQSTRPAQTAAERQNRQQQQQHQHQQRRCRTQADGQEHNNDHYPSTKTDCLGRENKQDLSGHEHGQQGSACFRQQGPDLADSGFADIVAGQQQQQQQHPDQHCQTAAASTTDGLFRKGSHEQPSVCHDDDDSVVGSFPHVSNDTTATRQQRITDNCQGIQSASDSMVLIEHQNKPFVVVDDTQPKIHEQLGNLDANRVATLNNNQKSSYAENSFSHSAGTPTKEEAEFYFTNKMTMISASHSDTNTSNCRDLACANQAHDNQDQEVRLGDNKGQQHQPLGPLQTNQAEPRQQQQQQQQPHESVSVLSKPNELAKAVTLKPAPQSAELIPVRQEPICDYYDLEPRPFARGKFAQVKRCTKRDTKECFAAKCIKKRRRLVDIRHEILLEIEALKLSYQTDYIVKLYEVYETPNEMVLILEMANGGELQRVLDDEESIDEPLVRKMVRQILEGLVHLHDVQIVHLDIKPQNLLLTKPFPNGDVKLCDFGISRRISECEIREICGTPDYTAPEVLQYDPISLNTDMWSLGVVTYVLLSGYSPFGSENKQQTFCNITTCSLDFPPELFDDISEEAIDFVRKLIVLEPSQRLTSRQALSHPWFNQ